MVKVSLMDLPPGYEELVAKILAWYNNLMYPTWATRNRQTTRSAKAANKAKTPMPSAAAAWKELTQDQKDAWGTAAVFGALNRYQLFLSNFCYRRKNGLELPGDPFPLHEVMGLELQNPSGVNEVRLRRDEKDLVGPLSIDFTYLKTENSPTGGTPFKFIATAYFFEAGKNNTEILECEVPAGDAGWTQVSESFGVPGRKYFHLTVIFYMDYYDAIIDLDHFLIADANGDKYRENWQFKAGKTWSYENLYRKTGWLFSPEYHVPYFEVVYLG